MTKTRVAILISGRGSNMAALLYASRLPDCPYEIALVSGDKPDAPGLALAQAEGVPVTRLDAKALRSDYWAQLDAALRTARIDTIALAGFMRIIPATFIAQWAGQIVNIHPSLLPKYKGLDTHARALAAGDSHGGCSVHIVTVELDAGEVLGEVAVAIQPGDDADSLAGRVLIAEHQLYSRTLARFALRERDPAWIVAKVGTLALALPETHFKTSHGAPGWRVGSASGGKFFAIMWLRHHGEDSVAVLVKSSGQDEMAALIDADPDRYFRPAYYGPSDWIGLRLDRAGVDWDHVGQWLEQSWKNVAPPRLTRLMTAADQF